MSKDNAAGEHEQIDQNLLFLRGVDSVSRISTNLLLVRTTGDERLARVNTEGTQTQGTLREENERETQHQIATGHRREKETLAVTKRESCSQDSVTRKGTSQTSDSGRESDGSVSPKVSLPPEDEVENGSDLTGLSGESREDATSLSTNLKEFLPKLLRVDKENRQLKETISQLEQKLVKLDTALQRSEDTRKQISGTETSQTSRKTETNEEGVNKRHDEYLKMKKQLKKALEANQAWNDYCKDQLKVHLKLLQTKDEKIRQLFERMKVGQPGPSSIEKQLKDKIIELETQLKSNTGTIAELESENHIIDLKNKQLEAEQRKVRKLAKGLIKEKEDKQRELDLTKEQFTKLSAKFKESNIKTTDEETNGNTSSESSTNLSYPLRNVESAMDHERLPEKEDTNETHENGVPRTGANIEKVQNIEKSKKPPDPFATDVNEMIYFLQEQVQQYRDDFSRERQDRERAFGELDKLRKELENAKLLLHQKSEVIEKKKSKKGLFGKHKQEKQRKEGPRGAEFRVLGPDEVTQLQERPAEVGQRVNTYEQDIQEEGNHVYHDIDMIDDN